MEAIDRVSKHGIVFTSIFYIILIGIIIVTLNIETENFIETLGLMIGLFFVIIGIEYMSQEINWGIRKRFSMVWSLIAKGVFICFFMSYIFLFIVTTSLIYILSDDTISKGIFNFIISFTFLSTLFFYHLYLKLNIPERMEKIITKFKKGEKTLNPILRNRIYKKEVINKIDFITICATVFLLGNSTFTTLVPDSLVLDKNPYNSIEFKSLFYLIPIYVQSAYYKLFP